MMGMAFNGVVGNLGDKGSVVTYDMSWKGEQLKGLEEFVRKVCADRKLEVLEVSHSSDKDGLFVVTARVRSDRGIV